MNDKEDEIKMDGDVVNGSFSSRAPKIKLSRVRFLFRDSTMRFIFKLFLFFAVGGVLAFAFWSQIFGFPLIAIALLLVLAISRYLSLRKIEFQNAVLSPGIVVAQNPIRVLVLANMNCGESDGPIWAVKIESCHSVKPLSSEVGTRIPCVTAFLGSGWEGAWDQMVSSPLTSGIGNRDELDRALARMNDEEEWKVLTDAIKNEMYPDVGKTLRLEPEGLALDS